MNVVVVSGNPRPGSRTRTLAVATARAVGEPVVVDVAELGADLLDASAPATAAALAAIRGAELLVVATPTYKASYTGVLKVLFDALPGGGLAGVTAAPVVVAGTAEQAARAAAALTELLTELGARCVDADLTATESQLGDPEAVAATGAALGAHLAAATG
jgi:FMN reductase